MNIIISFKNRINWIDWSKSICIYLVVLGHCHCNEQKYVNDIIYSFHMPLFFFISGILSKDILSKQSLLKNTKFLLIPYFTFGIVTILFEAICSHNTFNTTYYIATLRKLFFGVESIWPIWFLYALFTCKMLFYLIQEIKKYSFFLYFFFFGLSFFSIYFFQCYNIEFPFFIDSGCCAIPFYILGNEFGNRRTRPSIMKNKTNDVVNIIIVTVLFFIDYILLQTFQVNGIDISTCKYGNSLFFFYLCALLGIYSIVLLCKTLERIHSKLIIIISYGTIIILGLHGIFIRILDFYIPHIFGLDLIPYSVFGGVVVAALSVCLCVISIFFFDHFGYNFFGLKGKKIIIGSIKSSLS